MAMSDYLYMLIAARPVLLVVPGLVLLGLVVASLAARRGG